MRSGMGRAVRLALAMALLGAAPVAAARPPVLATDDQLAAETLLLALRADPQVRAIQARLIADYARTPTAATPDGGDRLRNAIDQWTNSLIIREIAADPARPQILWAVEDTPHRWFGRTVGGLGVSVDNPDHIYRSTFVDGAGRYELTGTIDPAHRPVQFSVESMRGSAGRRVVVAQNAGHADMGTQIALLTDKTVTIGPDGRFRILIGGPKEPGIDYLPTAPGPVSILLRDVLSDWSQRPIAYAMRRIDGRAIPARKPGDVRAAVIADLDGYVRFWANFKETWLGGVKPNATVGPVRRDGGWGYLAALHYVLAPDEVAVVTIAPTSAHYTGIQVTDPWMITPDNALHQASINNAQVTPDANGDTTYVIGPNDPHVANWLDTGGLREGYAAIRWQGFDDPGGPPPVIRGYRVMKAAEIAGLTGVKTVTPAERRAQYARRARDYRNRLTL